MLNIFIKQLQVVTLLTYFIIYLLMGLLGKTLKGRTAREGGLPPKKNIKVRHIAQTQEQFDILKDLAKMKKQTLRSKIENQHKIVNFNKKKLLTYWRKIMRITKTQELKNQIDIYSQNNQRQLDSKQAFIQMLDKNLDEAQTQFQIAIRNHLIHIQTLLEVQESRIQGLQQQFKRDVTILQNQFTTQKHEIEKTHNSHIKQLNDMIQTVKQQNRKKLQQTKTQQQTFRQDIKNKNLQQQNHLKFNLQSKQTKHYTQLQQMHQKYQSDTGKRTQQHKRAFDQNKKTTQSIDNLARQCNIKKSKIDLLKLKILQHKKQCSTRNNALKKQKQNISKNYQQLKQKMNRFRQQQQRRLKQLTNNSRNAVEKLKQYLNLGQRILKTAELCRRLQTEKQKVLPFYQTTVDQNQISQQMKNQFQQLTPQQYEQFKYLNNFFKRHNKVLLDKLAIQKQKQALGKDNGLLKSLLKQYLDGISLNDQVLRSINPLFVVNSNIRLTQQPVQEQKKPVIIDANVVHTQNVHQLGRMAPDRFG